MEGSNNKIVIRLTGIIVFLIIVIILMVAAGVLYKINSENRRKMDELSKYKDTLESEKQSLQGEVEELKEKNKNLESEVEKWKNTINEELGEDYIKTVEFGFKEVEDVDEDYDFDISSIPKEDINSLISDFLKVYLSMENYDLKFLIDSGLTDENKIKKYKLVIDSYYETDIKFDDYRSKMLNYMTEGCFNEEFCYDIKEKDEILYYSDAYSYPSDFKSFDILDIKINEEEDVYEVTANVKYADEQSKGEFSIEIVQKDGKPVVNSVY